MLRTIVHLLVARRERLCVARQIRLLLRFARRVTRRVLLGLLIVVGILLAELLLRSGDQTEIMFGMLVVVLGGYRVARSLRVACELDVFFRDVRGGAADFDIRAVRFVNPRQRILAFAVVAASPHALLTVSHGMPVYRLSACFGIRRTLTRVQVHTYLIARPDLHLSSAPMVEPQCSYRDSSSNPSAAVLPRRCQPLVTRI